MRTETCPPGVKTGDPIAPPGGYIGEACKFITDRRHRPRRQRVGSEQLGSTGRRLQESTGPRSARSSPPCSATWSGSPPPRSQPTPRTSTRCSPPTSRWHVPRSKRYGGIGREVHRGRRGRCLRGPRRTRGRSGACGAGGPADRRGRRGADLGRRSTAEAAGRDQHRRGARPSRSEPRARAKGSSPETRSTPPRGSSRSPPRWAWRSGIGDLRGHRGRLRLRRARTGDAQGQDRAGARLPREVTPGPLRYRPHPHPRHPVHRSRDRPRDR